MKDIEYSLLRYKVLTKMDAEKNAKLTQRERMEKGMVYDASASEILMEQLPLMDKLWEFNQLKPSDWEKKEKFMKEAFAECGENCYIELPFRANFGGRHVHFGNNVYANYNLTLVDDGHIYVGNRVMFAPNVTVATPNHPIVPGLRRAALQYNKDVHIEENAWIGANVVILPGVTIGRNSVIGAGSVVTKDIPANVVAYGNPCRVQREIGERDKKYFFRNEEIDWENLKEFPGPDDYW